MDVKRSLLLKCCVLMTLFSIARYLNFNGYTGEMIRTSLRRIASSRQTQYIQTGKPVNHIAFIKVPKAASTTVQNIFLRYGDEKNLTFALPSVNVAGGRALTSRYFYPPPKNGTYDITCTHITYNRAQFDKVLPNDTVYIAVIREPFSHFRSYVRFSRMQKILNLPGDNPVLKYTGQNKKPNQTRVKEYLQKIGKEIDIVLVLEFLDESIVLMRRILHWDMRHVLYAQLRINMQKDPRLKFGSDAAELHKSCAFFDYKLYGFFLNKLKENLRRQPSDFHDEVVYFRKIRTKYANFCLSVISAELLNTSVMFEGSAWNKPFVITPKDCKRQYIHDVVFLDMLKKKQLKQNWRKS
ncbi:galactose-3-O-sulfotransferase 2-like [Ylistrum balloti]|uniref:galactose-3-O-sulfotransferase 2-like n=1 Tax=Ylistrum balloti TaxID=509963 RepID=UPI002905A061|nr:galactose-3-O-sulfotransferase 2-like [Ylistrum balloti]